MAKRAKSVDSEVFINPTINDSSEVEKTSQNEKESVEKSFSKEMYGRTTVLVIDEGILTELSWGTDELEREMRKNNWEYRRATSDGRFILIDYDKDKARPYVKALLAKVGKLKEVKMLWWAIGLQIVSFLTIFVTVFVSIAMIDNLNTRVSKLSNNGTSVPILNRNTSKIDNLDNENSNVETVGKEGAKATTNRILNFQ